MGGGLIVCTPLLLTLVRDTDALRSRRHFGESITIDGAASEGVGFEKKSLERLFREIGSRHSRSPWTVERARGPRRLGTSRSSAAVNIDRRHFRVQRDQRGALPPEPPRTKQRILKERVLLSLGGSTSPLPVYFPVEPFYSIFCWS